MKKHLLGIIALPMLALSAPVAAQYYPNPKNQYARPGNANFTVRIDQLRARLQAGVQSGSITRREAGPIRQQIRQLSQLERQYGMNGLSGQERAVLQQRIRMVRQQLRAADNGANGRYAQWDAEDGYGQGYQQGYGQGYQQPVQQGGIAGVLGRILGTGGLEVGQRATGNLYGVPYQYQGQYRDGNGVYYRSDGRRIYQIDAHTQTVIRIFPM
jgi:hypothetical protein